MAKPDKPPGKPDKPPTEPIDPVDPIEPPIEPVDPPVEPIPPTIATPSLEWVTAADDLTPAFDVDGAVLEGTRITLRVDALSLPEPIIVVDDVDADELAAMTVSLGLEALEPGSYTAQVMLSEGDVKSLWSEPVQLDLVGPPEPEPGPNPGGSILRTDNSYSLDVDDVPLMRTT